MSKVYAIIQRNTDQQKFFRVPSDHIGIYEKMMQLTDNDHEISDDASSWCELATIGETYEFREGFISIEEE